MATVKPIHYELALRQINIVEKEENLATPPVISEVCERCDPRADPLFLDWRYSIICDSVEDFKQLMVSKKQIIIWRKEFPVVFPWDNQYDILRQNVNRRYVLFPIMIVMAKTETQVERAFNEMLKYGIKFSIRSIGHCYEPWSICDAGVIDQSQRTFVEIDPETQLITVEPGCTNGPTAFALDQYGLVIPSGTCASVGISGLLLGGGIGFLTRSFGLTCDSLVEAKMITATGKKITINTENHSDLFFALKGAGGGNFGIITSLKLKAYPVKEVIVLRLFWPEEKLEEVLQTWLDWAPFTDENLNTELDVFPITDIDPVPIVVTGLFIGNLEKLHELLQPLLELKPTKVELIETTYLKSAREFAYKSYLPPFWKNKSTFIFEQPPAEVSQVIRKFMRKAGPKDRLEMNALGGTFSKINSNETAFPYRHARAWIQWISRWGSNADEVSNLRDPWESYEVAPFKIAWVQKFYRKVRKAAGPSMRGKYINCPERELGNGLEQYYDGNLERLLKIKRKYDPTNVFNFPQGLGQLL